MATFTALASLLVALVAIGVAVAAWLRPMPESSPPPPPSEPTYSDQQIAKAKANVCEAYKTVRRAVVTNNDRPNPLPGDPIGALAAVANGRLALYAGGDYLLDRLTAEPATPPDLTKEIRSLANTLKEFGIAFLAEQPDSALDPFRHTVDSDFTTLDGLCK